MLLGWCRAEDSVADGGVNSCADSCVECFFHAAILAGMKGEDDCAAAGLQAIRKLAEECIER